LLKKITEEMQTQLDIVFLSIVYHKQTELACAPKNPRLFWD
jgi:hypothetical protein